MVTVPEDFAGLLRAQLAPVLELCAQLRKELGEAREEQRSAAARHEQQLEQLHREIAAARLQREGQDKRLEDHLESLRGDVQTIGEALASGDSAASAAPALDRDLEPAKKPEMTVSFLSGTAVPLPTVVLGSRVDEAKRKLETARPAPPGMGYELLIGKRVLKDADVVTAEIMKANITAVVKAPVPEHKNDEYILDLPDDCQFGLCRCQCKECHDEGNICCADY